MGQCSGVHVCAMICKGNGAEVGTLVGMHACTDSTQSFFGKRGLIMLITLSNCLSIR